MWRILCPLAFCTAYFYDVSSPGTEIANLDRMNFRLCMIVLFGVWTVCSCLWECAEKPVFELNCDEPKPVNRARCWRCGTLLARHPSLHCPDCDKPKADFADSQLPGRGMWRTKDNGPGSTPLLSADSQLPGRGTLRTMNDGPGSTTFLYNDAGNLVGGITHRDDGEDEWPSDPTFPPRGDHALSLRYPPSEG